MMNVVMLNVVMLSVVMLSVVMPSVVAPFQLSSLINCGFNHFNQPVNVIDNLRVQITNVDFLTISSLLSTVINYDREGATNCFLRCFPYVFKLSWFELIAMKYSH